MDRSEAVSTIREALLSAYSVGVYRKRAEDALAALGWLVEYCDTIEKVRDAARDLDASWTWTQQSGYVYTTMFETKLRWLREALAALGSSVAAKES